MISQIAGKSYPIGTINEIGKEVIVVERKKVSSYINQSQNLPIRNNTSNYHEDHGLGIYKYSSQIRHFIPPFWSVNSSNVIVKSFFYDSAWPSYTITTNGTIGPFLPPQNSFRISSSYKYTKQSDMGNRPLPLLKWLGLGAFWWAAFFDHYQDAIQDARGRKTHLFGADTRHWHFIKDLAHLGYLVTGFASGMELAKKKVSVKHFAFRMIGSVMIYWFIQNIVYDKALNNVWFDYERKYCDDGIVIFDLRGRDHRIELSKRTRPLLDVVRVVGGLYLVIKY